MEALQYPIGQFDFTQDVTSELIALWIDEISTLPTQIYQTVGELAPSMLERSYRPGGWTARQVIHHVPDSHMNGYVRFRLALTEEMPVVKGYAENLWADLSDARSAPIDMSLSLLESIHRRWSSLLQAMTPEQFARSYYMPTGAPITLALATGLYAWHGKHHMAHIQRVIEAGAEG